MMTSLPPGWSERPIGEITVGTAWTLGALLLTVLSAGAVGAWFVFGTLDAKADKGDVAELREVLEETRTGVAVNTEARSDLPEIRRAVYSVQAMARVMLQTKIVESVGDPVSEAMQLEAARVRAEAKREGREDPLAEIDGL